MLKSLVSLVTGGASGLGRATVSRFAQKGSRVVFCDLPESNGAEVAKEIGENAVYIPADVRSESDIENLLTEVQKKFGKLNMVVNCAAIQQSGETYNFPLGAPYSLEAMEKTFYTKVLGTINVNRLAVGLMNKNTPDEHGHRGLIINTAGVETFATSFAQVPSAGASGAIAAITIPLAKDLESAGIRVITISPGIMDTLKAELNWTPLIEEAVRNDLIKAPSRFGEPDEFAHLVQMVTTNPHINGTTIELSGGIS